MKILSVADLSSLPPVETLAATHLIAHGFNLIFGPSGAYKSFYMLHQALTIAQNAMVIYVAAEGTAGLSRRIVAWCEYYQQSGGQLYFLCQEVNLLESATVMSFIKAVQVIGSPSLIIFDTYARCMVGGDENSARDTGRVIQHCAEIQRQLDTAIALVHHSNKAERSERGSGALRGAADSIIEITANGDNTIKVDCSKAKDDAPWPPELYTFHQVKESGVLLPAALTGIPDVSKRQTDMLDFLSMEIFAEAGARGSQLLGGLNISQSTLYRALSDLKTRGFIRQDRMGDPYFITEKGKDALKHHYHSFSQQEQATKTNSDEDNSDDSQDSQIVIN